MRRRSAADEPSTAADSAFDLAVRALVYADTPATARAHAEAAVRARLMRALRSYGVPDGAVDDVAQEIFEYVFSDEGRRAIRTHPTPHWFLLSVARFRALRAVAGRRRQLMQHLLAAQAPAQNQEHLNVDAADELRLVYGEIEKLSPQARRALRLYASGLGASEISDAMGVKPATVRSLLSRGIHELRARLGLLGILPPRNR